MTKTMIKTFLQDEQGQDLVEYALLLAFIALAAVTMLTSVGTGVTTIFSKISSKIAAAPIT